MRALAGYHIGSPAPSVGDAGPGSSAPAPGVGAALQGGQQPYSMGLHEQYLASLRASLPAAMPQQGREPQQDGSQHGGQQVPASLPNMPRPPSGGKGSEAYNHQDGARASLDNSALDGGMSHLRGGGGAGDGVSAASPGAQHRNGSAADVANRFASAEARSQSPAQVQQHCEQQQGTAVAKQGGAHGPPLESKVDQEASGNTDDSASLDARMSANVADLLRGSSGSLTHMLHQQQAQQSQGQQPQDQYTGNSRASWDTGSNGGRVPQQQAASQPLPRT
jgi:hypothetical protein